MNMYKYVEETFNCGCMVDTSSAYSAVVTVKNILNTDIVYDLFSEINNRQLEGEFSSERFYEALYGALFEGISEIKEYISKIFLGNENIAKALDAVFTAGCITYGDNWCQFDLPATCDCMRLIRDRRTSSDVKIWDDSEYNPDCGYKLWSIVYHADKTHEPWVCIRN